MTRILAVLAFIVLPFSAFAEGVTHHVAFHVDENDPAVMNMTLNNAQNVQNYYASQGDSVVIEIVAYGPGLNMFVAANSPVVDRLAMMSLEMPNLTLSACGNTHVAMQQKSGTAVPLISEAVVVPSGVVQLISLQEQGFAYIRP